MPATRENDSTEDRRKYIPVSRFLSSSPHLRLDSFTLQIPSPSLFSSSAPFFFLHLNSRSCSFSLSASAGGRNQGLEFSYEFMQIAPPSRPAEIDDPNPWSSWILLPRYIALPKSRLSNIGAPLLYLVS